MPVANWVSKRFMLRSALKKFQTASIPSYEMEERKAGEEKGEGLAGTDRGTIRHGWNTRQDLRKGATMQTTPSRSEVQPRRKKGTGQRRKRGKRGGNCESTDAKGHSTQGEAPP